MPFLRSLIVFFSLFVSIDLWPQFQVKADVSEPYVSFFTIEDGLPSNEVYAIEKDNYGRLWLATDNGVSVYDGHSFRQYDIGNCSPVITDIQKTKQGKLWFCTVVGEIFAYDEHLNRMAQPIAFSDSLETANERFYRCNITDSFLIRHFTNGKTTVHSIKDNQAVFFSEYRSNVDEVNLINYHGSHFLLNGYSQSRVSQLKLNILNGQRLQSRLAVDVDLGKSIKTLTENEQYVFVVLSNHLFKYTKATGQVFEVSFNRDFTPFIFDQNDDYLWLGTRNDGAFKLEKDSLKIMDSLLDNRGVTRVLHDTLNRMWFTTLNKGLGYMRSKNVHFFKPASEEERVLQIVEHYDRLFVSTNAGQLFVIEQKGRCFTKTLLHQFKAPVRKMYLTNGKLVIRSGNQAFSLRADTGNRVERLSNPLKVKYHHIVRPRPSCIPASYVPRQYFSFENLGVYLGSFNSSYFYDHRTKLCLPITPNPKIDIRSACIYNEDTLLIGTKKDGLLLVLRDTILRQFTSGTKDLNAVMGIVNNPYAFFVNTGRKLFSIEEINGNRMVLKDWSLRLGLGTTVIHKIGSWGEYIIVSTSKGLILFKPTEKDPVLSPKVYGVAVQTKDTVIANPKLPISISSREKSIVVKVGAVGLKPEKGMHFRYRVLPMDSNWTRVSQEFTIPVASFKGDCQIEIAASNTDFKWSQSSWIHIAVFDPFWVTYQWLFVLLIFILGGVLGWYLFLYRHKIRLGYFSVIRKGKREWERLLHSKLVGVQQQIPPQRKRISVPTKGGMRVIVLDTVYRLEADSNYTNIVTSTAKPILISKTLKKFEESLDADAFLRVHRRHIVNLDKIKEYTTLDGGFLILSNNEEIPIGKSYRQEVYTAINKKVFKV